MKPSVAFDAPCPCGSGRRHGKCCGADPLRAAPRTAGELAVWAAERGVVDQLRTPAEAILARQERPARDVPHWVRSRMTVADLLAPEELLPFLDGKPLRFLREKAWAFLLEEAESVREAIAAEGRPRQLPCDPTLQALSARLLELREKVRAEAAPRALSRVGLHGVRLDPEQRRLIYYEQRKVRRAIGAGALKPAVTLDLARHREEPLPMPQCSCRSEPTCTHALAAIDSALAAMVDASHAEEWARLALALEEPGWARALRALEVAGAARRARLSRPESLVVSFRIGVLHGGHLSVTPYLHKRLHRGGYSAGTRASPRQLAGGTSHLAPEDRPALESLGYFSRHGYDYGLSSSRNEAAAIEKLIGHPRVFFEDDPASPVTVQPAAIGLALRQLDGVGFEIVPTIGGEPVEAKGLAESLAELGPAGLFVRIDQRNLRCQVVTVSAPEDAGAVVRALVAHGQRFPAEAEALLFERLGLLQEMLPIEVPASLQGEEVPAEGRLVLELRLRASGLELRALVRPLEGALGHPPGGGPSRLSVVRDGRRVFVRRDTAAEEALAREVLASLPLDGARAEAQFRFVVPEDAEALEIVERLRAVDRRDVSVEWVGDPPRLVRAVQPRSLRVEVEDRHDWFGLSGEIEVDGERVELALLLEAIRERRRFVRLGGKAWLEIAGELAERLAPLAHLSQQGREGVEIGPAAFSALDDLERDGASLDARGAFATLLARMRAASAEVPAVPKAFTAALRDYQMDGFHWLARLGTWGAGACLADDMGLGKTLQALALLCLRSSEGPALVVAPTSVCANWTKEAQRFAPSLNVTLYREANREGAVSRLEAGEVLVASYGLVTRDLERFKAVRFGTLVLDEAQAVKNAATRRARAVRELDAGFRVALTGTPVENHLGELWSLYRIVFPGLLGSWDLFRERFALPVERDRDPARRKALAAALRPFLLRRTKGEVARELPTRTEIQLPVSLSPEERRLYDDARLAAMARLAGQEEGRPEQRRFQVLAAITKLRLLACHPRLHDAETGVASSKLARFLSLASDLKEGGHRALVFSQFTRHLSLVREALDADGASYLYLDGQTPPAQRDRLVERFQAGEGDLFLISLKAGGTGLNLTGADYVVHLDPWWNPAVEDQATDRAHRIGQTKPVTVYRLVAQGTIEEAIVSLHAEKRDLVAGVLDGMDSAGKLSPEDLMALIRAGPEGAGPTENECELEKGSPLPPAWRVSSPAAVSDDHAALIGRFERHLREEYARGKLHSDGPAKSYPRAARRFLEFVALECGTQPIEGSFGNSGEFDDLVRRYLEALRTGRFPAPSSEPILARSALRRLGDFIASAGCAGMPSPDSGDRLN